MPLNHFFLLCHLLSFDFSFQCLSSFPRKYKIPPMIHPINTSTDKHSNRNKKTFSSWIYIKMEWSTPSYIFNCQYSLSRRRQWHPTPVHLPGKSHGQRSLVGSSPQSRKEVDTPEVTQHASNRMIWPVNLGFFRSTHYQRLNVHFIQKNFKEKMLGNWNDISHWNWKKHRTNTLRLVQRKFDQLSRSCHPP